MPPGYLPVLVFFTLSGYVISLLNTSALNSSTKIKNVIKRGESRLYPIYLLSLALTILLAATYNVFFSTQIIMRHLFFLQTITGPLIYDNNALWSLSYEVSYYILFIVISYFKLPTALVVCGYLTYAICEPV